MHGSQLNEITLQEQYFLDVMSQPHAGQRCEDFGIFITET
jgi:hypothetical protein